MARKCILRGIILDKVPPRLFKKWALAGVAQWIERRPANQRVTSLIPIHSTCLDCTLGPQLGAQERQPHMDVSLPLFLPPFPSLKINK